MCEAAHHCLWDFKPLLTLPLSLSESLSRSLSTILHLHTPPSVPLDRRAPISIALMKGPHVLPEKLQERSHDSSERTRLIGCLMYNSG